MPVCLPKIFKKTLAILNPLLNKQKLQNCYLRSKQTSLPNIPKISNFSSSVRWLTKFLASP